MGTNKGQCNDNFINHDLINGQILRDDQQNELSHTYDSFGFEHVAIWFWSISCYAYLYTDSRSKYKQSEYKNSNSLDIQQLVFPKISLVDNYWLQ